MTNRKSTKRALLSSALALILCFAMLLGTTYAWFTDSVTSANNIIKAGNLDVTLEYWNGTEWKDVEGASDILSGDLWEPGYVDVAYLRIKNAGSLALKYQLGVNIVSETAGVNVAGESFKLSNYIYFDVFAGVNGEKAPFADRAAAMKDTTEKTLISAGYTQNGTLLAGTDYVYLAMVVYMPTTVGNVANHNGTNVPEIDLGINIMATQLASESDSFGDDYDENAAFSMWDGTVPAEMPESLVVDTEKKLISINDAEAFAYFNTLCNDPAFYDKYGSKWKYSVELNADIDLANKAWTPITMSNFVAFEGNNHTIKNLYVDTTEENAGLFASISCNDIGVTYVNNLTIDGAYVRSAKRAGVIAGSNPQGAIQNVTVNNAIVIGVKYVGGVFGGGNGSVINSTVKNTSILIDEVVIDPEDNSIDSKEAGGLIGYLANDGTASSENKIISGNTVENVVISAPSIASGLVSQPNSANKGTALIVIEFNTLKNVTVTTTDDTADIFVSNNVGGKSIVRNNTEIDCTVNKSGELTTVEVVDAPEDLAAAVKNNDIVIVKAGEYSFPAGGNFSASDVVKCEEGTVFTGLAKLNINGATVDGATFSNPNGTAADQTINGTFKNCTFTGTNGLRWCYAGKTTVFENCVFSGDVYGAHFDGGANEVLFKNCTFSGFNAVGSAITLATYEGCTFKANDTSNYNGINLWGDSVLTNCTFVFDGSVDYEWVEICGSGKTATFEGCVVTDGTNETPIEDVASARAGAFLVFK